MHLPKSVCFREEKGSFLCTVINLKIMKCLQYHREGKVSRKGSLRERMNVTSFRLTTEGTKDGSEIWPKVLLHKRTNLLHNILDKIFWILQ